VRPSLPRLLLLFLLSAVLAAAAELRTLRSSGPDATSLNVVFLGDGYVTAEKEKFFTDVQAKMATLLGSEAFSSFQDRINVHAIFAESAQSGITTPSAGIVRNTYFQTSFGVGGIDRLLAITGPDGLSRLNALLAGFTPSYDIVILLANSLEYGGSGGSYACLSLNQHSDEVLLHELGHSFAHLSDEYVDAQVGGNGYQSPNSTNQTQRELIPWARYILADTALPTAGEGTALDTGLYEGAVYLAKGWYRPTYVSKMRSLDYPFGPVNVQAFAAAALLTLGSGFQVATVCGPTTVYAGQKTALYAILASPEGWQYQWYRDGVALAGATLPVLAFPKVSRASAGLYSFEARGASGSVRSGEFFLADGGLLHPTISPSPLLAKPGATVVLTAGGVDGQGVAYQWYKDGVALAGANSAALCVSFLQLSDLGCYGVEASSLAGSGYAEARLLSEGPPVILEQPTSATCQTGGGLTLSVRGSSYLPAVYQWYKDGLAVTGATSPELGLSAFSDAQAGAYWVVITSAAGSVRSATAQVSLENAPLSNLSVRGRSPDLQVGFVAGDGSRSLLVRAVGPGLAAFGLSGVLADPVLELHHVVSNLDLIDDLNDNWDAAGAAVSLSPLFSSLGAFALVPGTLDSAMQVSIDGPRSLLVHGADGSAGVVLVEVYDLPASGAGQLTNLSARGYAGTGSQTLAAGFVLSGSKPRRLILRGVGPSLSAYGVSGALANPRLELFRTINGQNSSVASNDDWGSTTALRQAFAAVGAFDYQATDSKSAALDLTLQPGVYSVVVTSADGGTGTALVEIYLVP
jgi:hypothetical protein